MSKRFLLVLLACILGLGGIFWLSKDKADTPSSNAQPSNHVIGENKKDITLLEYGDYQCPVCYQYYPIINEVTEKYKADIQFQFSNLPLVQIHKNAFAAARAAEAAGLQNKFWEMHSQLYETQDPEGTSGWVASSDPLTIFVNYASQLGINVDQFKQDYASSVVNDLINADIAAFNQTKNKQSTPAFFLNGRKLENNPSAEYFSQEIEKEIANKK